MSIQEIRLFGDPVLLTPASAVIDFDKELRNLVADLTDTMLEAPGAEFFMGGKMEGSPPQQQPGSEPEPTAPATGLPATGLPATGFELK